MTNIPDGIMRAAEQAWRRCWAPQSDDTVLGSEAIALAILAERERCAAVADAEANAHWVRSRSPQDSALCELVAGAIAEAIRKGEQ